MPTLTDDAVIIKTHQSGDADVIVHLLSGTRGRRTAYARAALKSRKRFAGSLQPFHHIQASLTIKRTQKFDRLDSADLLNSFPAIHQDLGKLMLAMYYCEILDLLLVEGEQYPEIYNMVLFFLNRLESSEASVKHRLFFEVKLLDLLGERPDFSTCADTGIPLGENAWFEPGRLACVNQKPLHTTPLPVQMSSGTSQILMHITAYPFEQLVKIKMTKQQASEALQIMNLVISALLPRPLKSLVMLEKELTI